MRLAERLKNIVWAGLNIADVGCEERTVCDFK